jgi:cell wall-associated NlpC family hydrolase
MEIPLQRPWLVGLSIFCVAPVLRAQSTVPAILMGHQPHAIETVETLPEPSRKPFAAFSASAMSLRDSAVAVVRAQLGTRYRRGGTTPERGFDCSGLVRYVMATLHIDVPRTANEQAKFGVVVPRDTTHLRPGDLLTFGFGKRVSHIGIYVGDGLFVHASSAAGRVIESPVNRPLVRRVKPWKGARRVVITPDDSTTSNQ